MNSDIRQLFPVTNNYVYLNHAAVAPLSIPVVEAMQRYTYDLREHGLVHWREWGAQVERVREIAARLVNANSNEIAFAANTSTGLSIVANGLDWKAGDNIVSADCEFPSNQLPWQRLQQTHGVQIRQAKERDGRVETEEILNLIDDRTKLVTLSFVEFASGFRNDLETIGKHCRERNIWFVVDAIQGLGGLKLDVETCCIDAFAADAHKYLLGPEGIAILYVSERMLPHLKPTILGWTSVKEPFQFAKQEKEFAVGARRFEPGTLNVAGIAGLGASIDLMLQLGMETIEQYLLELSEYLCERLAQNDYRVISSRRAGEASAVVCCTHEKYSAESLHQKLETHRIITTPRMGRLRISPHFYNNHEDIDALLAALPT